VSGPVHFRRTGRITGFRSDSAAASGPRRLRIRVAGWGEPAQVHARGVGGISLASVAVAMGLMRFAGM